MHRRYGVPVVAALVFMILLGACGGGSMATATGIPTTAAMPATATTAPTIPPTTAPTAVPAATVTRPALPTAPGSVITGTTAAGSVAAGTGMTLFTDPMGRFSFSRPAAWTVGPPAPAGSASVVAFTTANPPGSVDISTEASSGTTTQYVRAARAEITKSIPDVREVGTTNLQLDSEPAVQIDYTGTASGKTIYFSQIFALHKGTAYILTFGTRPAESEQMKQQARVVVRTWKFLQ